MNLACQHGVLYYVCMYIRCKVISVERVTFIYLFKRFFEWLSRIVRNRFKCNDNRVHVLHFGIWRKSGKFSAKWRSRANELSVLFILNTLSGVGVSSCSNGTSSQTAEQPFQSYRDCLFISFETPIHPKESAHQSYFCATEFRIIQYCIHTQDKSEYKL